mgnify:CR=1 FL=1
MRAHAPWDVRAAGASGHALARIVHRVLGLLHRVVRFRLDHCHHVSAYGSDGEWHAQRVDDARGSRAVRYGECICAAIARSMAQQRAGRQSASGQSHEEPHDAFDV